MSDDGGRASAQSYEGGEDDQHSDTAPRTPDGEPTQPLSPVSDSPYSPPASPDNQPHSPDQPQADDGEDANETSGGYEPNDDENAAEPASPAGDEEQDVSYGSNEAQDEEAEGDQSINAEYETLPVRRSTELEFPEGNLLESPVGSPDGERELQEVHPHDPATTTGHISQPSSDSYAVGKSPLVASVPVSAEDAAQNEPIVTNSALYTGGAVDRGTLGEPVGDPLSAADGEQEPGDNDSDEGIIRHFTLLVRITHLDVPKVRRSKAVLDSDDDEGDGVPQEDAAENDEDEPSVSPKKRRTAVLDSDEDSDAEGEKERVEGGANEEDEEAGPKSPDRTAKGLFGSDDDDSDNEDKEKTDDMGELMTNIFGDDSDVDEDQAEKGDAEKPVASDDENEPKIIGVDREDSDDGGKVWDFDVMLQKKKKERRKRRHRDGGIDLISDADDKVKEIVDAMERAAHLDRQANQDRKPAFQKHKMLQIVRSALLRADYFEALLDNRMMNAVAEWLAPLPDKSLPSLEVRTTILKILEGFPRLEQGILKQSGLGKAVMFLFKHPRETRENKLIAAKLIREWARPIFNIDSDYRSLSREERVQQDLTHMPEIKRKRLRAGIPSE
ncbi:IWS1 C-terminus family protein [Aphelenchoides avenae]|nr:IWS1 C-terminus family protein [Aphelenchus avenae]